MNDDAFNPLIPGFEAMRKDAERWRWLTTDCDGDLQDDFVRWLAGHVASKEDIDNKVDAAMSEAKQ